MQATSNSKRLRDVIERGMPEMSRASNALAKHPQFRSLYPKFLIRVHQMIRATVPLMRAALARCREIEATDPVAAAMAPYLEQHIKEEMHHDEWTLEDLEFLGVPRAAVLRQIPSATVASLIGAQYYWIFHHHPVAHLGQVMAIEGYPGTEATVDRLVALTGYPRRAFRTIEKHCHLDVHHRDDLIDHLNQLPLREEHHAILEISAAHVMQTATQLYREVVAEGESADEPAPPVAVCA